MAAIFSGTITLHPTPGSVVKSKIVDGSGIHIYLTKVFINICHDANVPKPAVEFDPVVVFPLIVNNEWEIPIVVSPEKSEKDKKGVPSFVYDCCMNTECFNWIQVNADLKLIAVEWCIEAVELMHGIVLEREYSTPKMLCKGQLSEIEITKEELEQGLQKRMQELKNNETLGIIEELTVDENNVLPDLMDIEGKKLRPLIEEISDMSIAGEKEQTQKEKEKKEDQELLAIRSQSKLDKGTDQVRGLSLANKPLAYTFTVTQLSRANNHVILFESPQLTPFVDVTQRGNCITIKNCDSARTLGADDQVDIPVPDGVCAYQSFAVPGSALYIFCR